MGMITKLVTLPVRVGLSATRTTLGITTKLAGRVAGEVITVVYSQVIARQPHERATTPSGTRPGTATAAKPSRTGAGAAATPGSGAPAGGSRADDGARRDATSSNGAANGAGAAASAASALASTPSPTPAPKAATTAPSTDAAPSADEEAPSTPLTAEEAAAKTIDDSDEVVAEFAEPGAEDGAGAQLTLEEPWDGYDAANADEITARIADSDAAQLALIELYEQTHKGRKTVLEAAGRRLAQLTSATGS